jgi:single-strand DNA-binding protein
MYAIRNKVQLIGNLGQAPEIRITETGKKLARFSIATNDTYRNSNGVKTNQTTWHNVIAWGKLADIAEKYLTKGREVAVCGKLVYHNYTDKKGINRRATEVVLSELLMLGGGHKSPHENQEWLEEVSADAEAA